MKWLRCLPLGHLRGALACLLGLLAAPPCSLGRCDVAWLVRGACGNEWSLIARLKACVPSIIKCLSPFFASACLTSVRWKQEASEVAAKKAGGKRKRRKSCRLNRFCQPAAEAS
eukprot:scaffold1430_cov257-Pinguiococcus_pyrenoidosus.AAC.19